MRRNILILLVVDSGFIAAMWLLLLGRCPRIRTLLGDLHTISRPSIIMKVIQWFQVMEVLVAWVVVHA
jgi:hypothetical protein